LQDNNRCKYRKISFGVFTQTVRQPRGWRKFYAKFTQTLCTAYVRSFVNSLRQA